MDAGDLQVTRWRRYGKDRLYVERPDGSKVGFWDLLTDTGHAESPQGERALITAVTTWRARADGGQSAEAPAPTCDPTLVTPSPGPEPAAALGPLPVGAHVNPAPDAGGAARPWVDLAANRPGASAREQAQAAREAAPVKTTLARVLGVHTNERAWRIGADGEEKVAAQLAKTTKKDPRWRAVHAIPIGNRGSDIDHLIVGPGGVFTVNAKNHPKANIWVGGNTFMVNGTRVPYIRNARYEAERAAKLLTVACGFPVHVEGLIVTVNATDVVIKTQPDGVSVTWRNNLPKWLLGHGDILDTATLDAIYEAARRSITWRG
ncbi:NERD domain-containing protein [Nocardioides sp. HDW12B]|nr:NERD domain-containing protein [Nocardioides sp. HDW12B]